jgi:DNA-binding NtrC family response regulator
MEEAVGPDEGAGRAAPPWMGAVLLDRDAVTLESVADALETSGVDVRIAGHPEEVALLLRTADAATLGAVVCDVMAFRSDQNVAGLIRTWERDRPGLTYFLSFDPDSAGEVERARRIPTSIISGHLPRPLSPPRLLETLETLAKRRGKL